MYSKQLHRVCRGHILLVLGIRAIPGRAGFVDAMLHAISTQRDQYSWKITSIISMAPSLPASITQMTYDMIVSSGLNASQMANQPVAINRPSRHRSNVRLFGSATAPPNKGGRLRSLSPLMIQVLCDHWLEKPQLDLAGVIVFLLD